MRKGRVIRCMMVEEWLNAKVDVSCAVRVGRGAGVEGMCDRVWGWVWLEWEGYSEIG